jgi:hypothetical protein
MDQTKFQRPEAGRTLRVPIGEVLSEPMTIVRLAQLFHVHRTLMSRVLQRMEGAEKFGGLWRVPIRRMPIGYLRDQGLIGEE